MSDQTTSSLVVAASPAEVMAVVADVGAYPEWAAAVKKADVLSTHQDGRAAQARIKLDAGAIRDEYVLGYDYDGDTEARWTLVEPGSMLTAMDGAYRLSPLPGGDTEVTYTLSVDVSIPMIGMFRRKAEKVIIDTALKELKKRVEG